MAGTLLERIEETAQKGASRIEAADDAASLEQVRIAYLGRKGAVATLLKEMASLPPDKRPEAGARINALKETLARRLEEKKASLTAAAAAEGGIDITVPGTPPRLGSIHPITQTFEELLRVSANLGFEVVRGPEVETEHYNFEALNIPLEHPSRDAFDTFYIRDDVLLRSHTSPVQIHVMESRTPPLRVVVPGKVYRPDTVDAGHHYMFHHLEGLMVGPDVTMRDLKTVLLLFFQGMWGPRIRIRLRPSFFPFTEPSAEADGSCIFCDAAGCSFCKMKGWLELAGCGMVDPNVFAAVGYDAEKYTGFAFGIGVDRVAMMKYGINDIRLLTGNDIRFLRQF